MKVRVRKYRGRRLRKRFDFDSVPEAEEFIRDDAQYSRVIHDYVVTSEK